MAKPQKQDPLGKQKAAQRRIQFSMMSRLAKAMAGEFTLQDIFKLGYRNKEDVSNLPPYVLSVGSQNVLTNAAEQVVIRNGFQFDGPAGNQNTYGIDSGYDFDTHTNGIQNLRKWGTTLEVRYVNPSTKAITWIPIETDLNPAYVANFTEFWDESTEMKNLCLFVNGNNVVHEWTGAVGSFASATSNTITLSGTSNLSDLNFYTNANNAGKMNLLIDGVTYTYTGAGNSPSTPYTENPTNAKIAIGPSSWISQLFTTGSGASTITNVTFGLNAVAAQTYPTNFTVAVYTNNAGIPGTLVGMGTTSAATIGNSGDFAISFGNLNIGVTPSTAYQLVLYCDQGSGNINAYIGNSSGVGTNTSSNSGATWSASNGFLFATVTENNVSGLTFTGVTPDPTLVTINVGDAVVQPPVVGIALANGVPQPFNINLITTSRNQVYYGSFANNTVYISKVNNYSDCSFSTPRVVGEGASITLDATPVAFIAQENGVYMSAGPSYWYGTVFTLSSDLANESLAVSRLQTSSGQGAVSQAYVSKAKNSIVYVSNEPLFNSFGSVKNILTDPQVMNMSDPIKYDMDAYTFEGGAVHYFNYFIYFSVPKQGVVRLYNVNKKYWEAPQTMPVGIFYEVDGQLYGHDATTNASYQLFVAGTYNDCGNPINAVAAFPYVSSEAAKPFQKKFFNKFYTEGYIAGNTSLTLTVNYDFGGFSGTYSNVISGQDKKIIFNKITDGSIGKNTLGTEPIGTILNLPQPSPIPKFRKISTFTPVNNYEYQVVYSSYDVDQNWALLRFGPAIGGARDLAVEISE